MPDLPEARIAHATANRVRLKVPTRRHDHAYFQNVAERLRTCRAIERVAVNPATASILVHFSDPARLWREAMNGNDLFRIVPGPLSAGARSEPDPPLLTQLQDTLAATDGSLRRWTGGSLDLRTTVFATLFVAGVQQFAQGNVAAPAATLLWYAATVIGLPGAPQAARGARETV
ncbi:MAG: HMA2 domain-containing protein [Stellaceae bacterium]